MYYILTVIQFWLTIYFIDVIHVSEFKTNVMFALICLTSPTLGAVTSGYLSHWLGGYEHPNAIPFCIFLGVLEFLLSLPMPFFDDY